MRKPPTVRLAWFHAPKAANPHLDFLVRGPIEVRPPFRFDDSLETWRAIAAAWELTQDPAAVFALIDELGAVTRCPVQHTGAWRDVCRLCRDARLLWPVSQGRVEGQGRDGFSAAAIWDQVRLLQRQPPRPRAEGGPLP